MEREKLPLQRQRGKGVLSMKKTMQWLCALLVLAMVLSLVPMTAQAATGSGNCGVNTTNVKWKLTSDGTLTISGTGAMADYTTSSTAPWYNYTSSITSIVVQEGVTYIGNYAFYKCYYATSISLPQSLTAIGEYAFYRCQKVTSITVPDSVTSFGQYAFSGCYALTTINIPDGVTVIPDGCFSEAVLTEIKIPDGVTSIGAQAFKYSEFTEVEIPSSVTTIGSGAFYWCSKLTDIVIPDSVTSLGTKVLYGCKKLTSVTLPANITEIPASAFESCAALTSIEIPDKVTTIGEKAFYYCDNLRWAIIPASVTSLGTYAFSMSGDQNIYIFQGDMPTIGAAAFSNMDAYVFHPANNATWSDASFADGHYSLKEYGWIGENILWAIGVDDSYSTNWQVLCVGGAGDIPDYTLNANGESSAPWYDYANDLYELRLCVGLTDIGDYAFYDLFYIDEANIPEGVSGIGRMAFAGCVNLDGVTIPASLTTIGARAFDESLMQYGFTVNASNTSFATDENGYLCSKDLTRLIRVDNADQTYTIPGTVTSVASGFIGRDTVKQVTFQGNAPSFDSEAFALVDAMAVYPENDATWTDEVKQQYGGTIDWRSTGEQIVQSGAMSGLVGWELLQNGTLVISGTGDMPTKSYSQYPWYAYRSQIKKVVIEPGITSVAEYAFYSTYYPNLTTVSLPEGLESIDDYAFQKLSSLVEINIPSTVTGIGDYAFDRCASLDSLTIQPGVKSIGSNAFSDCDALTSVTIPGTVETVGYGAFEYCGKLASVVIEDGVTDLGQYAFAYCPVLTDVTLPDSITTMNTACFRADPMLKAFKIPSGVTVLRQYLFYGCTSLGVVTIPATVTEIENGAFYGCTIERVIFEDFVPTIHSASFTNVETPVYYVRQAFQNHPYRDRTQQRRSSDGECSGSQLCGGRKLRKRGVLHCLWYRNQP